jgi:hypothetical protein
MTLGTYCPFVLHSINMLEFECHLLVVFLISNWLNQIELREQMVSSPSKWFHPRVTHLFSFLSVVLFVLSVFVLCVQCCQCLWIVHSWLLLRFSITFICIWVYDCSVILHVKSETFLIFSVSVVEIQHHIEIEKVI